MGNLPARLRLAAIVPVPKVSSSSDVGEYRPISITPVVSKLSEKIAAGKLSNFWMVTFCFLFLSSRIVEA